MAENTLRLVTTRTRSVPSDWAMAISRFSDAQRGAGSSPNTISSYAQRLEQVARAIQCDLVDVTRDRLLAFAGTQVWATETRRTRYTTFKVFWRWAKHAKVTKHDASKGLPKVKPGEPTPNPVPDRVYRKALMRATERERLWLELAHDMGLRRGEIAVGHSDDIFEDLIGDSLLVHGKGDKLRVVPLVPSIAARLRALGPGWFWPGDLDGHISPRWVGKRATILLDGPWTIHKLRHRAITSFYLTHGEFVAQELAGHASPLTTRRYVKLPNEKLREAVLAAAS